MRATDNFMCHQSINNLSNNRPYVNPTNVMIIDSLALNVLLFTNFK